MTYSLESRMQLTLHVRFGGGRLEKYHDSSWQLAGRLPYADSHTYFFLTVPEFGAG